MQDAEHLAERAFALANAGRVREGARVLRDRLELDPTDADVRGALAQLYRRAGHLDQAGRYEIGTPNAVAVEQDLYLRSLIAIGADEERIRSLSVLPADAVLPDAVVQRLEQFRRERTSSGWETVAWVGGIAFVVVAGLTVIIVYFTVLFGGSLAQLVAQVGGVASGAMLAVFTLGMSMSFVVDGSRKAAVGWAIATALVTMLVVLAVVAFVR